MTAKLNWGIVTTGGIARKFATDLRRSRTGRLAAVGARKLADGQKFATEFGGDHGAARAHGSYDALLADPEVQAVYLATMHPWHKEWALKAIAAGKHLLCEKPLTLNFADTREVVNAAKARGVLLMEAFMYRCHPQTLKLVELIRDGAIGELRLIRASFNIRREFDPENRMFKRAFGGGAILDLGCYPVSFSRLIAGAALGRPFAEPVEFHATGRRHPLVQTDDCAAAAVKYPGDIVAELSTGSTVIHEVYAKIYGSKGWIDVPTPFFPGLDAKTDRFFLHRDGAAAPEEFVYPCPSGLYAYEADAVAAAIARGATEVPEMPWADTLGIAMMLDAWLAAVGVNYDGI
ncbi:MAG TPA: Gfo/Idh/MocA family oxidoreductase [Lacunisphaera sp.]|nr:Gfo/Idh/MocA family oxidoreductase [Lacunisphaera sp.]